MGSREDRREFIKQIGAAPRRLNVAPVFSLLHREHESLLFVSAQNSIDCGAADNALALKCGLTIFHGDSLGVLHFRLFLAFYTVIQIGQCFHPPTSKLEKCHIPILGMNSAGQKYLVSLSLHMLLYF